MRALHRLVAGMPRVRLEPDLVHVRAESGGAGLVSGVRPIKKNKSSLSAHFHLWIHAEHEPVPL